MPYFYGADTDIVVVDRDGEWRSGVEVQKSLDTLRLYVDLACTHEDKPERVS
jgi:hypothetical protein